ncbi:MAG: hypothetical protein M3Z03_00260, partial [Actinomycetota bacterium]|nr:hypothetical protein [Actinomycetota bacterium]
PHPPRMMTATPRRSPATPARRVLVVATVVLLVGLPTPAGAQGLPEPYEDPPFTCTVHDYGQTAPPLIAPPDDPLCVRYDKTNASLDDLGILDFLAGEPGRVAMVAGKCGYWQQDHWVIGVGAGLPPAIAWVGSYWYDLRTGTAGAALRSLEVLGQPVDATSFVAALRPLVGDDVAEQLAPYADPGGGGGVSYALPSGTTGGLCGPAVSPAAVDAPPGSAAPDAAAPAPQPGRLPATGEDPRLLTGGVLLVLAVAGRRLLLVD